MCFCDVSRIVANSKILIISGAPIRMIFQNSVTFVLQYSSQVTSPAGTREYHNGTHRKAPMLRCHAQDLRVTAWITTSHASIFTRQQGARVKDQPAPRPAEHSSLHPIVASHLLRIFIRLPGLVAPEVALIISSNCPRLLF